MRNRQNSDSSPEPARNLPEAAKRALAEAAERRRQQEGAVPPHGGAKEIGGPSGPEPTRYGDWEKKGIVSDF